MKGKNKIHYIFIAVVVMAAFFTSCGGGKDDPAPSAQDQVKEKLIANTWTIQSVTVDGVDQSSVYKNITLKFSSTTYSSTNGGAIWPSNGMWSFTDQTAATIKKEDGTEVIVEATDSSLKLTLTWTKTTLGVGKIKSVKGLHVFTFRK